MGPRTSSGNGAHVVTAADSVERRALRRRAARAVSRADQVLRIQLDTVVGAGHAGDRLLHQRPTEVVDAPAQRLGRGIEAHLHPARLQAGDRAPEGEAEDRGVLEVLLARDLLDPVLAAELRLERDEAE